MFMATFTINYKAVLGYEVISKSSNDAPRTNDL